MRITLAVTLVALMAIVSVPAFAELQNVTTGGSIIIRYNYYSPEATGLSFTDRGNSTEFFEQRTRLNVRADFTNDVSAFIELDSYDIYGEDFRSAYVTGVDMRASTAGDVEIYQAYIEIREAWGYPVDLKIGRQEIMLGNEFLIGNNSTGSIFMGLSFDGITAVYNHDQFSLTGVFAKLADRSPAEEDGDTDLWSIYASYTGIEDVTIDAYWILIDDGLSPTKTTPGIVRGIGNLGLDVITAIENFFGVDRYDDTTTLHTVGLRGAGSRAGVDFEAEVAYQFGNAALAPTIPSFLPFAYGDDNAEFDAWAMNAEIGYTFDVQTQPRIYVGAAFFDGGDDRDNSLGDFIASLLPFSSQDARIGFNRIFSDVEYGEFLDATDLSNSIIGRAGISLQPTESLDLSVHTLYFQAHEETNLRPFFGGGDDDELGWEVSAYLTYHYSEDLVFDFGYSHFFAGDGIEDGNFVVNNGFGLVGGSIFPRSNDDADYLFFETSISF